MFEPDLFSDPRPKFHEAAEQSVAEVSAVLLAHYPDIGAPEGRVYQSGALEINTSNFLVRAGGCGYIVKRWPSGTTPERSTRNTQAALTNWLAQQDVRVPGIRGSAVSGDLVIEHEQCCWCVMDYVAGDYFSGEGNEFLDAGIALHGLFLVLRRAPDALRILQIIEPATQQSLEIMAELERQRASWPRIFSEPYATLLSAAWSGVTAALERILELEPALRSSIGPCHIDLHPHNVLMSGGKTTAFLDFHSLMQAPSGSMIAFNLFKLARQAIVARDGNGPDADVRAQRDEIVARLGASSLIGRHAPDDLSLLAKAEIMRRLLLILHLNLEMNNRDWNHVLPVQIRALKEADRVFS